MTMWETEAMLALPWDGWFDGNVSNKLDYYYCCCYYYYYYVIILVL